MKEMVSYGKIIMMREVIFVCSQSEALQILEQAYHRVNKVLPVEDAYLYGSYARGDHRKDSDVDIFITSSSSNQEVETCRWDIAKIASHLSLEHDVVVSVCVRPSASFEPERNFYHANIAREGIRYQAGKVSA